MAYLDAYTRIPWPSPHTSVFQSSPVFNNTREYFPNDIEMEDISEVETMDYEITPNEDFLDPVAQVRQVEEDEKLAFRLQTQYDAEVHFNGDQLNSRNFSSPSSSRRPQNHHVRQQYELLQEQLQTINLLLRTWTPFFSEDSYEVNISTPFFPEDSYESLLRISVQIGEHSKGLKKHQIRVLPTRKFSSIQPTESTSDGSNSQDCQDCIICLCEYKDEEVLRTLPCCHEFHVACIDKWLKLHNTCPICRTEISRQQFGRKRK